MKKQNPGLIAKLLNKNSQPTGQGVHNGHPCLGVHYEHRA